MRRFRSLPLLALLAWLPATSGAAEMAAAGGDGNPLTPWSGQIAAFDEPPARIVLEGIMTDTGFQPMRARVPSEAPKIEPLRLIPFDSDILAGAELRVFGVEERTSAVRTGNGIRVECRAGSAPAGVVIGTGRTYLPRAVDATLHFDAQADRPFEIGVIARDSEGAAVASTSTGGNTGRLDLPELGWSARPAFHDLRILCPAEGGTLNLGEVSVRLANGAPDDTATGTWLWSADEALADRGRLASQLADDGVQRIFLQLPIKDGAVQRQGELHSLISELGETGIAVHAVEGDPQMVLPDGLRNALARADAIRSFRDASPPQSRLAGVQYDIEPYALPDYARDPLPVWNAWENAVAELSLRLGEPVSVVVPFWMSGVRQAEAALEAALPAISDVVIMAYRTTAEEIVAASEPWLAWGSAKGKPVTIALENGPLPEEVHRIYLRAETGTLAIDASGQGDPKITLAKDSLTISSGMLLYELDRESSVASGRITFDGQRARLNEVTAAIRPLLSAWDAYQGLAIHELGYRGDGAQ